MKKYIYQELTCPTIKELNILGAQGWRIIQMMGTPHPMNYPNSICHKAILERETAFPDPSGDGRL